jgi:hypothetical protein
MAAFVGLLRFQLPDRLVVLPTRGTWRAQGLPENRPEPNASFHHSSFGSHFDRRQELFAPTAEGKIHHLWRGYDSRPPGRLTHLQQSALGDHPPRCARCPRARGLRHRGPSVPFGHGSRTPERPVLRAAAEIAWKLRCYAERMPLCVKERRWSYSRLVRCPSDAAVLPAILAPWPSSRPSVAVVLPHLQVVRPRFAAGAPPRPAASPTAGWQRPGKPSSAPGSSQLLRQR